MQRIIPYLFLFLLSASTISAQTYEMDTYDGQTVSTCSGRFTDSRSGDADYANNEDYTVTFCSSTAGQYLRFIINPNENAAGYAIADAGDILRVYEGTGTGGTLIATYTNADDPGSNAMLLQATSDCITFHWVSDGSGDSDGWEMEIECVPQGCGNNPAPADDFANAPYVCNFEGFCASTRGYTDDEPFNFVGGGSCPGPIFGGTIENNSWVAFEAAGPNISFDIEVVGCYGAFGYEPNPGAGLGIQAAILSYDGASTLTRISDCSLSDGTQLSMTLTNTTPLVTGDTYYLVVDGSAGSQCDYSINVSGDAAVVDAGTDQTICSGASATLTATGPTGSTFSWEELGGGFGPTAGASVSVSPTTTTDYVVSVTSPGGCNNQTDIVRVNVTAIDDLTIGAQTACVPASNTYTQEVTVTYTNPPGSGDLVVHGQSFAITSSPQTVTLTGLTADGNAVDVTASFSAGAMCSRTESSLFTAPAACNATSCSVDAITAGTQTACVPATNTYTQEVTVTYTDPPGSGNLVVHGQSFAITSSPQTVTLTGLTADGNAVDVTANFSADGACTRTESSLFTAPAGCGTTCSPDNGTWD